MEKSKCKNFKSKKVEVGKSKNIISQKMFYKIISAQTDHWVNISSSSMHVLNDPLHWMIIEDENEKWNLKFLKLKSWSRKIKKNYKSKMFEKILSVGFFQHLDFLSTEMRKSIVPRLSVRFPIQKIFISVTHRHTDGQTDGQKDRPI